MLVATIVTMPKIITFLGSRKLLLSNKMHVDALGSNWNSKLLAFKLTK